MNTDKKYKPEAQAKEQWDGRCGFFSPGEPVSF